MTTMNSDSPNIFNCYCGYSWNLNYHTVIFKVNILRYNAC